ncbi:MAG: DUF4404 family protein [Chloroflexales bacterium]|nr:DUF4404 family protein [Chloroflexales bacterium]
MDSKLRELLQQLHTELDQTQSLDEITRSQLEHLAGDIRSILERTEGMRADENPVLHDRLGNTIEQFEASHPQLTTIMAQITEALRRTF